MSNTADDFSQKSQANARLAGSYWKIAETAESKRCVFCELKDKYIVDEKNGLVLTVNLFPYINGHMLVIPRRHVENFLELTPEEIATANELMQKSIKLLRGELSVDGIWLVLRDGQIAEKTVKHLHWQVMPYKNGLNQWNYQEITLPPIELAERLRNAL